MKYLTLLLGIGLILASRATDTSTDRLDAFHEAQESGSHVVGRVDELHELERTRYVGTRRSRRSETYTVQCPVVTFKLPRKPRQSFVEYEACDADYQVGDKVDVVADGTVTHIDSETVEKGLAPEKHTPWVFYGLAALMFLISAFGWAVWAVQWRDRLRRRKERKRQVSPPGS